MESEIRWIDPANQERTEEATIEHSKLLESGQARRGPHC